MDLFSLISSVYFMRCLAFVFVLGFVSSCTKEPVNESLSIDDYRKLGVPDPSKRWTMEEFSSAYAALGRLKWDNPYKLPQKGNKKSGALFDHMLSHDNMYFLYDPSLSLNAKAEQISSFLNVYDYWEDVYSNPVIDKKFYDRERLYVNLFNLRMIDKMVALGLQIMKSEEPSAVALQYGVPAIKTNYLTSVKANLKKQAEAPPSIVRDVEVAADTVYSSVLKNTSWLDSAGRAELKSSLQLVLRSTNSAHVKQKYTSLESAL